MQLCNERYYDLQASYINHSTMYDCNGLYGCHQSVDWTDLFLFKMKLHDEVQYREIVPSVEF